jgi:hypothetical protein
VSDVDTTVPSGRVFTRAPLDAITVVAVFVAVGDVFVRCSFPAASKAIS